MKKYVIVKGGLGNQMFQYAFYKALIKQGIDACLDITLFSRLEMHNGFELPSIFGVNDKYVTQPVILQKLIDIINKICPKAFTTRDTSVYFDAFKSRIILNGYWQSEYYFSGAKEDIQEIFNFRNIDIKNINTASKMQSENSVSIHIRRGDYVGLGRYANICTEEYYRKAINHIVENVVCPRFYIFSNDVVWSLRFANDLGIEYEIITCNSGENSYKDMYLMTQCRHNILANSSFSWWGAYLNLYEHAIKIAPIGWDYQDTEEYNKIRIPQSWIRL